jgi:TonB family protein
MLLADLLNSRSGETGKMQIGLNDDSSGRTRCLLAGILVLLCFLINHNLYAQLDAGHDGNSPYGDSLVTEMVYTSVDVRPSFPGGMRSLYKYFSRNLNYPSKAKNDKIEGRVIIQFVVTKEGSVRDVSVLEGVEESLDAEAVRVVSEMPEWIPGKKDGQNVNVYLIVPVTFYITEER